MKHPTEPANDPRVNTTINATVEATIDAALSGVRSAVPTEGFEGRILSRLAQERMKMETAPTARPLFGTRLPVRALGLVSACLMGFVIVAASVSHSRKVRPGPLVTPPAIVLPGHGIGAASAVHPAAPASAPVTASQAARGRSARRSGRARIAPHARKAPGVAVPAPPAGSPSSDSPN